MKCQICHENDATIVFTKIVNTEKSVIHICGECAKKKGLTIDIVATPFQQDVPVFAHPSDEEHEQAQDASDAVCASCGLGYADFKRSGYLGCDHCYEAFDAQIAVVLKQIHGFSAHQGKVPAHSADDQDLRKQLRTLRRRLRRCVETEEYERAAELRDTITSLEERLVRHDV